MTVDVKPNIFEQHVVPHIGKRTHIGGRGLAQLRSE
jgi:hypothetical protein